MRCDRFATVIFSTIVSMTPRPSVSGRTVTTLDIAIASPTDPRLFMWLPALAAAYYQLRHYEQAIEIARRAWDLNRKWPTGLRYAVAGLGQLGRTEETQVVLADFESTRWRHGPRRTNFDPPVQRSSRRRPHPRRVTQSWFRITGDGSGGRGLGRPRQYPFPYRQRCSPASTR